MNIAIILSTTRQTRIADKPAQWLYQEASSRRDMRVELLDLRDYPMPFFDEVTSSLYAPSSSEVAQRWQQKIAEFDGFIFVVAEYNRSIPAVLKNALDYAYLEWNKKPAAYLGYGAVGAARATEQLRLICVELEMAPLRKGVHIQGADFFAMWQEARSLEATPHLQEGVTAMLDELSWWAEALKTQRERVVKLTH